MFHMMNEARIAVGLGATMLGFAGYEASLDYAKSRPQGRPIGPGGKDASQAAGADHRARRRQAHAARAEELLRRRARARALLRRLVDELHTGDDAARSRAHLLLEVLTPIAKSWPSEWCLEANSLAIQVLGGYGYTRDFPVEQYWRDNRLNMIHEGTHGIQALDLLGRKVVMDGGAGLDVVRAAIDATIARARRIAGARRARRRRCARAADDVAAATRAAWSTGVPAEALANATPYLQAFGHVVLAWIWLDVATCAAAAAPSDAQRGRLAACRYFFRYELPKIGAWLGVVAARDDTCRTMAEESVLKPLGAAHSTR